MNKGFFLSILAAVSLTFVYGPVNAHDRYRDQDQWNLLSDVSADLEDACDRLEDEAKDRYKMLKTEESYILFKHAKAAEDISDKLNNYLEPSRAPYRKDFSRAHIAFLRQELGQHLDAIRAQVLIQYSVEETMDKQIDPKQGQQVPTKEVPKPLDESPSQDQVRPQNKQVDQVDQNPKPEEHAQKQVKQEEQPAQQKQVKPEPKVEQQPEQVEQKQVEQKQVEQQDQPVQQNPEIVEEVPDEGKKQYEQVRQSSVAEVRSYRFFSTSMTEVESLLSQFDSAFNELPESEW